MTSSSAAAPPPTTRLDRALPVPGTATPTAASPVEFAAVLGHYSDRAVNEPRASEHALRLARINLALRADHPAYADDAGARSWWA